MFQHCMSGSSERSAPLPTTILAFGSTLVQRRFDSPVGLASKTMSVFPAALT